MSAHAPRQLAAALALGWAALQTLGCPGGAGVLVAEEDPLDLGATAPGVLLEGRVALTNSGDADIDIADVWWADDHGGVFRFSAGGLPLTATLPPGGRYQARVIFSSDSEGVFWGRLAIEHSAADEPLEVAINAAAVQAGTDADGDGVTVEHGDCDDGDPSSYPGADELCDGADNDCDGFVPHDEEDADGDGWMGCEGDCADGLAEVHPGADEGCDGIDTDCDGEVTDFLDGDGDGISACGGDCDDGDAEVHPWAAERCNGVDDDCDGSPAADEVDGDGDGALACEDCDDTDPLVFPGALEVCDGIDNDCDGSIADEGDLDGDGWRGCDGDCDDTDALVFPGAPERCNGVDDDCDGAVLSDEVDDDGDGALACEDCDDADPTIHPGAVELCNGVDDDCDGWLPADEEDLDNDGWRGCDGDCDDGDPNANPDRAEHCNGVDDDCDGQIDEADADGCQGYHADADGDGFGDPLDSLCLCDPDPAGVYVLFDDTDCYDANALANPDATAFRDVDRGDGSFDYDCDHIEEPQSTAVGACQPGPDGECVGSAGWLGGVPACGAQGQWIQVCYEHDEQCLSTIAMRLQGCR